MGSGIDWFDRQLRSAAYDVLCRRDRISGWKRSRDALLASARQDSAARAPDVLSSLQRIVMHAYETTTYYRRLWDDIGFRPTAAFSLENLSGLPFLTKEIIRERKTEMISNRFSPDEIELSYTGGTTGVQTSFYLDHECKVARVGRQWGMLELCGYRPGMRRGLVWGVHADLPPPGARQGFKRMIRRYAGSQETLDCTVMHEHSMREFHARLTRFRPEVLYGYPSALTELGRFIEEERLDPVRVKTIITTAERLSEANRAQLQRIYGGEVFSLYATREYGCIGFECRKHEGLHVDTGSVLLEILNEGRPVPTGESGEIVITDLLNYGMPFIRSRTGDAGALSPEPCECGCPLPVLCALDGRLSDVVFRPDGSLVPGVMISDVFRELRPIRYFQFVQESLTRLDVRLVMAGEFSEATRAQALREVREIIGDEIEIRIHLVDEIERNPRSGKIQEVICKVDRRRSSEAAHSGA